MQTRKSLHTHTHGRDYPCTSVNVATQSVEFLFATILLFLFARPLKTPLPVSRAVYFLPEHTVSSKSVWSPLMKLNFMGKFSQIIGNNLLLSIAKMAKTSTSPA
uniref:Uncharacterized protein n=1 Tax=Glossina palpalis gambiensis TaxID=67801 RepID=A0A1B0B3N4_9MUSC